MILEEARYIFVMLTIKTLLFRQLIDLQVRPALVIGKILMSIAFVTDCIRLPI